MSKLTLRLVIKLLAKKTANTIYTKLTKLKQLTINNTTNKSVAEIFIIVLMILRVFLLYLLSILSNIFAPSKGSTGNILKLASRRLHLKKSAVNTYVSGIIHQRLVHSKHIKKFIQGPAKAIAKRSSF